MADDIDRGNETAAQTLDMIIRQTRSKVTDRLMPVGECYNCGEPVDGQRTFCDPDCREDYDHRKRRGAR